MGGWDFGDEKEFDDYAGLEELSLQILAVPCIFHLLSLSVLSICQYLGIDQLFPLSAQSRNIGLQFLILQLQQDLPLPQLADPGEMLPAELAGGGLGGRDGGGRGPLFEGEFADELAVVHLTVEFKCE